MGNGIIRTPITEVFRHGITTVIYTVNFNKYIYIYIYIKREIEKKERERERPSRMAL